MGKRRRDEEFWDWDETRYPGAIAPSPLSREWVEEMELDEWGLRRRAASRRRASLESGRGVKGSLKLFLVFGLIAAAGLVISGRFESALIVSALTGVSFLVSMLIARRRWS